MNKRILYALPILMFFAFYACQKFDQNIPDLPDDDVIDMKSLQIPDGFDWELSKEYDIYVSGGSGETVKITSADGNVIYHKGTYIEDNGSYKVELKLPVDVGQIQINGDLVNLAGTTINHDLSNKSASIFKLTNYALSFDGVDDYVSLGDISELNGTSTFTIEGWANQTSNTDDEMIFQKWVDMFDDISVHTIGGTMFIDVGDGTNTYATWPGYSATITSGTWFHWAVVYDGSAGSNADRLKLYINGNTTPIVLSFSGTIPATTSSSLSGQDARLSHLGSGEPFGGYMDEVRIWSDVRTPSEINDKYNEIIPSTEAGLVANWRMDEGTGTTTYDETSNDYDATIDGATWALWSNTWDSDGDGVSDLNDDYPLDPTKAYDNFYPPADTGTLVFEDLWPATGDYDFNDLVLGFRFQTVTSATNAVLYVTAYFEIRAHGAHMINGFGFQLPSAAAGILSDVVVSGYSNTQSYITYDPTTKFESGQSKPVVIVMDRIGALMGQFNNTLEFKPAIPYVPLTVTMSVVANSYTAADFAINTWNPFMIIGQNRGYEVHKIDNAPTDLVNAMPFGTLDDDSDPGNNEYYRTENGLPWALEFPATFEYPYEYANITLAYLHFRTWAETGAPSDWYSNTAAGYRNTTYIYD